MPLASQNQQVVAYVFSDPPEPSCEESGLPDEAVDHAIFWGAPNFGYASSQPQQVGTYLLSDDAEHLGWRKNQWVSQFPGDEHVARNDLDGAITRAIVVMSDFISPPTAVAVSNCTLYELARWDSPSPANFGGDGHEYWAAWYMDITAEYDPDTGFFGVVDIETVGAGEYFNYFFAAEPIRREGGTYGDGVEVGSTFDYVYAASFGAASATTSVSPNVAGTRPCSRYGDLNYLFTDITVRSIDNLTDDYVFRLAGGQDFSATYIDSIPPPSNWIFDNVDDAVGHTVTMGNTISAVADFFPGACRVLGAQFGCRLRAWAED